MKKFNKSSLGSLFDPISFKESLVRIFAYEQHPRVMIKNNRIKSSFIHFTSTIAKIDDFTIQYIVPRDTNLNYLQAYKDKLFMNRAVEMTVNTDLIQIEATPSLMTYEYSGECVIVPIQKDHMITRWIFFEVVFLIIDT